MSRSTSRSPPSKSPNKSPTSGAKLVFVSSNECSPNSRTLVLDGITDIRSTTTFGDPNPPAPLGNSPAPSPQPPAPTSLATILYTSGTTGRPRGVMLSHDNLASNAAAGRVLRRDSRRTPLCILPLSHIYARTCDLYTWIYRGSQLVLAESRETLARDWPSSTRPPSMPCHSSTRELPTEFELRPATNINKPPRRVLRRPNRNSLLRRRALRAEIEAWYADQGLPVLLGYGLTETSPVISASTPRAHRPGAVGRLLANVEVRIAADGELLTRGPHVMLGYWHE